MHSRHVTRYNEGRKLIGMDVKKQFFLGIGREYHFKIISNQNGMFAGSGNLLNQAMKLSLKDIRVAPDGMELKEGKPVFEATGDAVTVSLAEERLLGMIGKPSGVATSARGLVALADRRIEVVCGAWKKVFPQTKEDLRKAIRVGGAGIRITNPPFIYVDKNYVRIIGGVGRSVCRAAAFPGRTVVVQIKGEFKGIGDEAIEAAQAGAHIIMVDTGNVEDIRMVSQALSHKALRKDVKIGFGGAVTPDALERVIEAGEDIVDVGRAIIDAPIIDFRFDVMGGE